MRRLRIAEAAGPAGTILLRGPGAGDGDPFAGPLVVCIDGSDESRSLLPDAKRWHATRPGPVWVVCRVLRPVPAAGTTLLEVGCAFRVARALAADAAWDAVGGAPASVAAFARTVGASVLMLAAVPERRGRGFDFARAVAAMSPCAVAVPRLTLLGGSPPRRGRRWPAGLASPSR